MEYDGVEIPDLNPDEESAFEAWAKKNKIRDPMNPLHHYDHVSAFRMGVNRGEEGHFPDTYKTPGHETFSNESQYYKPGMKAGRWEGDKFIPIPPSKFETYRKQKKAGPGE